MPLNIIRMDEDEEEVKEDIPPLSSRSSAKIPRLFVSSQNIYSSGLPIFRGIHICGPNFVQKFGMTFITDSLEIAKIINRKPGEKAIRNEAFDR